MGQFTDGYVSWEWAVTKLKMSVNQWDDIVN